MLREYTIVFRRVMTGIDLAVMAGSFFLAYTILWQRQDIVPLSLQSYAVFLPILLVMWGFLLTHFGMYESFRVRPLSEVIDILFKASMYGLLCFGGLVYLLRVEYLPRYLIIYTVIIADLLTALEKITLSGVFRIMRRRGFNPRQILIIGSGPRARFFIQQVTRHRELGLRVIGVVDDDPELNGTRVEGFPVLGTLNDMAALLRQQVVDDVVIVVPRSWLTKIEGVVRLCELEGVRVHVAVDYFNLRFAKAQQSEWLGFPLLSFTMTPDRLWDLLLKRALDIAVIIATAPLALLVAGWCCFLIRRDGPGPLVFRQMRSGINGRKFMMYKFRTMVPGAHEQQEALRPQNELNGPAFKMTDDSRLTAAGKILRRWSLDELPQLWNVLKGDMSLAGPRPALPDEVERYDNWQRRRLSMRPGMTSLWQIRPLKQPADFYEWMRMDLEYIDTWSLALDLKILLKSLVVIVIGRW